MTIFAICRQMLARVLLSLLSFGYVVPELAVEEFATFIFENGVFTDDSDDGYTNGMGYAWGRAGFDGLDDSLFAGYQAEMA
jgi:hypothetical protein